MGVTYTHSAGYGIVVERDCITDELLRVIEYHPDDGDLNSLDAFHAAADERYGGDLCEAWENEDGDTYEVVAFICRKYGLNFATAGSHYDGEICYLVGDASSDHNFWFEESSMFTQFNIDETEKRLYRFMSDIGKTFKIGFYSGMSIG